MELSPVEEALNDAIEAWQYVESCMEPDKPVDPNVVVFAIQGACREMAHVLCTMKESL